MIENDRICGRDESYELEYMDISHDALIAYEKTNLIFVSFSKNKKLCWFEEALMVS